MTPFTVYIATGNSGKMRDFAVAAAAVSQDWHITSLPGLASIAGPPEEGTSFAENARSKALYYAAHAPGMIVVADDSGLEVDALGGAPGVYSARYAERTGFTEPVPTPDTQLDERNNAAVLAALGGDADRTARYRCTLAAARDGRLLAESSGVLQGELLTHPRGSGGFGYDPLFFVTTHSLARGCTMAELDAPTRISLSHRGQALRALLPQLVLLLP